MVVFWLGLGPNIGHLLLLESSLYDPLNHPPSQSENRLFDNTFQYIIAIPLH